MSRIVNPMKNGPKTSTIKYESCSPSALLHFTAAEMASLGFTAVAFQQWKHWKIRQSSRKLVPVFANELPLYRLQRKRFDPASFIAQLTLQGSQSCVSTLQSLGTSLQWARRYFLYRNRTSRIGDFLADMWITPTLHSKWQLIVRHAKRLV